MCAADDAPFLDVDSIAYRYPRTTTPALLDTSFRVRRGVVIGLVGPNGSGKTTLFRLILGLVAPDRGTITVAGLDPASYRERRGIGYLPEQVPLPPGVSVRQFAEYVGRLANLRDRRLGEAVESWLEVLGLGPRSKIKIGALSHGYRQRVGLLAALLGEPELLLLDEPGGGLDPISLGVLRTLLRMLRRQGRTVVVSSHNLSEVERVCDEVVILFEGRALGHRSREALAGEPDVWVVQAAAEGMQQIVRFGGIRLARDEAAFADEPSARRFASAAGAMGAEVYAVERRPADLELLFHRLTQRRLIEEAE